MVAPVPSIQFFEGISEELDDVAEFRGKKAFFNIKE